MTELKDLEKILKKDQILSDSESLQVYAKDWTTYFEPKASAVVFPESTKDLQQIVWMAREKSIALVPSGGRTGLSGGAVAVNGELVVSMERMNKVLDFNEADLCLEVEAGAITDEIKNFAAEKGYFFPLNFGATGSSQIGGNIATNAGGQNVLHYGNTRNWVSGLEVVTGRGEILNLNRGLTKNATGFDLRHLFIGSEGILGFITKAQLRLCPPPKATKTAVFATDSWSKVIEIFTLLRKLEPLAFEVYDQACYKRVLAAGVAEKNLEENYPLYLIFEYESPDGQTDPLENLMDPLFDKELALDGVQSQNPRQAASFWAVRENITETLSREKPYKNDVSVRSSKIPTFVASLEELVSSEYKDFEVLWFGHVGDGNLHINILRPENMSREQFVQKCRDVDQKMFSKLQDFQGSISAEHGVGLTKKDFLGFTRSSEELEYFKLIKKAFDPDGILNPGKMIDS